MYLIEVTFASDGEDSDGEDFFKINPNLLLWISYNNLDQHKYKSHDLIEVTFTFDGKKKNSNDNKKKLWKIRFHKYNIVFNNLWKFESTR